MAGLKKRANGDFLVTDFKNTNRLANGNTILPLYSYTISPHQIKSMTFLAARGNEVQLINSTIEGGSSYFVYTGRQYVILTLGNEMWVWK